jgi:integrase
MLEREPFSIDEVRLSFNLFDKEKFEQDLQLLYKILAYTGMRASEIAKGVIGYENGVHFIDLSTVHEALKTKSSRRQIPLHRELIKLGVHKRYEEIKNLYTSDALSYKFRKKIKPKVTDNPRKTMYSYRHTLATQLKYEGVNPLVISEILGHAHDGMTLGRYANRYPVDVLKKAIDKLEFI